MTHRREKTSQTPSACLGALSWVGLTPLPSFLLLPLSLPLLPSPSLLSLCYLLLVYLPHPLCLSLSPSLPLPLPPLLSLFASPSVTLCVCLRRLKDSCLFLSPQYFWLSVSLNVEVMFSEGEHFKAQTDQCVDTAEPSSLKCDRQRPQGASSASPKRCSLVIRRPATQENSLFWQSDALNFGLI